MLEFHAEVFSVFINRVMKGRRSLSVSQFNKILLLVSFFPLKKSRTQNFRMYARLETVRALYGFSLESVVLESIVTICPQRLLVINTHMCTHF